MNLVQICNYEEKLIIKTLEREKMQKNSIQTRILFNQMLEFDFFPFKFKCCISFKDLIPLSFCAENFKIEILEENTVLQHWVT